MEAIRLLTTCKEAGIDFFTGVPDSQLKGLCDCLYEQLGVSSQSHVVAANEGGAMGLAMGHYLATGQPALVYMQNSGLGNIVNPYCSLMDNKVYGIPCLLVVGWRGEPGVKDEPQHAFAGEVTMEQLELMGLHPFILDKDVTDAAFDTAFKQLKDELDSGRCAAILVRKGGLTASVHVKYSNDCHMSREQAETTIIRLAGERDIFVSTTGKISRELFETRESLRQGHERDFLTVGGMGHASMIALGIALEKPDRQVWCLDGDGAAVMHMGAMAVLASRSPKNYIHVIVNNGAHESVGGMPVAEGRMRFCRIAKELGYSKVWQCTDEASLESAVTAALQTEGLRLIEVFCSIASRADLGRPTTTPKQNRDAFMNYVQGSASNK